MATNTADLLIRIYGESKDAVNALRETEDAIERTEATTKKSGKSMKGVWASVASAMLACVRASAQLESATQGLNTIFGEQADEMLDWADGMAQYGLSTAQAAGAATILGAQLKNAGASAEQMTIITQGLIETSTALAAVLGGSAVDAVAAMGAAMRGEFDSLERYGITLTADAVATEAARLASEGYTFASEQQAKMVATLALIQQQATIILGESEEQTITAKVAMDHLIASVKNLAAEIGGPLIQVLAVFIETIADAIDKIVVAWQEAETLQAVLEILGEWLTIIADICETVLVPALETLSDMWDRISDLLERTVIPILDAVTAALDRISKALEKVIGWIQQAIDWFGNLVDSIGEAWDSLTFWNNNATVETPSGMAVAAPAMPRARSRAATPTAGNIPAPVTVTLNGVVNPQIIGRELAGMIAGAQIRTGWQGIKT